MAGAMTGDAAQKQIFSARLKRLEANARSGRQTVLMGDGEISMREMRRVLVSEDAPARRAPSGLTGPLAWLIAFLSGAAAVVIARYLQAEWAGVSLTGAPSRDALLTDLGLGLFVALVLRAAFGLRWSQFALLQVPVAVAMVIGMHNLVHLAPEAFSILYSGPWVDTVLTSTEMRTILVPGNAIQF